MEINSPIVVNKKIPWLLHISLNNVISKNSSPNIFIVILYTSFFRSRAKKMMLCLYYFALLLNFYVCIYVYAP